MTNIKVKKIIEILQRGNHNRGALKIEIVDINEIDGGVEVFARAWKNGKQIGFGKDGTVGIERFRIFNPPILVPDENGDIVREWEEEDLDTGKKIAKQRKLREEPQEALLQVIEHNLSVMKNIHDDSNIVAGKRGNTTSTFYPDAGTGGGSYDGGFSNDDVTWANAHDTTTPDLTFDTATALELNFNTNYRVQRQFYGFDTSPLTGEEITSAVLTTTASRNSLGSATNIRLVTFDSTSTNSVTSADFAVSNWGTTALSDTEYNYNDINGDGTTDDWILNSAGISAINKSGVTFLAPRNIQHDINDVAPGTGGTESDITIGIYQADQTGSTNDPKLVVEHVLSANSNSRRLQMFM